LDHSAEITRFLNSWQKDTSGWDEHWPLLYRGLKRMARSVRRSPRDSFSDTDIIHEMMLRLMARKEDLVFENRVQFYSYAARLMRGIVINKARAIYAQMRNGGHRLATLDDTVSSQDAEVERVLAINDALDKLMQIDAAMARIIELRFFAGFTISETASILNMSEATVKRTYALARTWLYRELQENTGDNSLL